MMMMMTMTTTHGEVRCQADDEEDPRADSRRAVLKVVLPGAALLLMPASHQLPDQIAYTAHDRGQGVEEQQCCSASQQPRKPPSIS